MTRARRTTLFALAGLVGALAVSTPAQAVPDGAEPLFEVAPTIVPERLEPKSRTAAGIVYGGQDPDTLWVQPTGGEAVLEPTFSVYVDNTSNWIAGDLLASPAGGKLIWRTISDPVHREHTWPLGLSFGTGTSTGYVALRGSGPYEVVRVDLLAGGTTTVVGTSPVNLGSLVASSTGVVGKGSDGKYRHFAFASSGVDRVVPTPSGTGDCPWLSRSHLFCRGSHGAVHRVSVNTGATETRYDGMERPVETATGVAYAAWALDDSGWELRTWASTAASPTVRVNSSFGLTGHVSAGPGGRSVLVSRTGVLGRSGLWSVPLPSGTSTLALAAEPRPRKAQGVVALAPGSVAWADNSSVGGSIWTKDLTAAGVPTGEARLVAKSGDPRSLSASAGRFTYEATQVEVGQAYPRGTRLTDGVTVTTIDSRAIEATLSGDRLLSAHNPEDGRSEAWQLRDLRTGAVTELAAAEDYDLWGERLVRLDEDGRVILLDLRTGAAPVELRAATTDGDSTGTVHIAGDHVAWSIDDGTSDTYDNAIRDLTTAGPAEPLPGDLLVVRDLSTGYLLGTWCPDGCYTGAMALDDGALTDVGAGGAAVDGNVVATLDADGVPSVQTLPTYADAPRLLGVVQTSPVAGPGRFWQARVVTSRALSTCTIEIRDGSDAVVKTLDCTNPYAAETVLWNGKGEDGEALPAGAYTWHLTGAAGAENLIDYDGNPAAPTGALTVEDPAPTVTATSPASGATGMGRTANVIVAFSEPVVGVSTTTVRLSTPSGTVVPASVTYNATSRKATLNPNATLAARTRYTVGVAGGTTAIRDAAGQPLKTKTWSFTTGS